MSGVESFPYHYSSIQKKLQVKFHTAAGQRALIENHLSLWLLHRKHSQSPVFFA